MKDIVILGGPNGAGKTTAAQVILPKDLGVLEFVNADNIAKGLSPFNVDAVAFKAARLMMERIESLVATETSFSFETTCAGRQHAYWLRRCKSDGWRITLIYLWLPTVELALSRVAERVAKGGHSIPPDVIARRHAAGLRNVRELYLPLADIAAIYDNTNRARTLVAEKPLGGSLAVRDHTRWAAMLETKT